MRFFPSANRQRIAVTSMVAAMALGGLAVPLANADDDLHDRQKTVEKQIESAHSDLQEASKRVQRSTAALEAVRGQLLDAKTKLDDVRTRLAAARARDRAAQLLLVAAEQALEQAQQDVLDGQAALALQRESVVDTVNSMYEQGPAELLAFASLMNADSPEDLTRRLDAQSAIVGREDRAYASLDEAEILLRAREIEVTRAKQDMADRRRDAAANLDLVRELLDEAKVAKAGVITLLQSNRAARETALSARKQDKAALASLKRREDRIKEAILEAARRAAAKGNTGYQGDIGGLLARPVDGAVTSPYGYRIHPIYGYYGLHDGTDFGVACGESMRAVSAGTVTQAYYSSVYGNRLYLSVGMINGKNVTVVYNHASGYRVGVGDRVGRGDTVGYVGSTGWSTGCHLHFTVLVNGDSTDPMNYF